MLQRFERIGTGRTAPLEFCTYRCIAEWHAPLFAQDLLFCDALRQE